jgi:hypothetical protein
MGPLGLADQKPVRLRGSFFREMDPVPAPGIRVSFAVDIEIEYDPFKGRTPEETAGLLEESVSDILFEAHPHVLSTTTQVTNIEVFGNA